MKRWNDPFPPTPQGFHERVESTLRGLDQDNMKHLSYKRIAAVVAAALIALLAVAAAAESVMTESALFVRVFAW